MMSVLLDNWTIHNSISFLINQKYKCGSQYTIASSDLIHDDMENFIMSILLWDKVFFWDTKTAQKWKSFAQKTHMDIPFHPVEIDKKTESLILQHSDFDVVSGGATKYQMLANHLQLDYLPEKCREKYLHIDWYSGDIEKLNWQKYCVEKIENEVNSFYDSIVCMIGDARIQFEFPLLLSYIINKAGHGTDLIQCLSELRNSTPLLDMRLWLKNLHNYINSGNWIEVRNCIKNVNDIVSSIESHSDKRANFSVGLFPVCFTNNIELNLNPADIAQHFQLTFLRDIAQFGLNSRSLR